MERENYRTIDPQMYRVTAAQPVPQGTNAYAVIARFHLREALDSHVQTDFTFLSSEIDTISAESVEFNSFYSLLTSDVQSEPRNYSKAIRSQSAAQWGIAIGEEFEAHAKKQTWTVVPKIEVPNECFIIDSTWIFKIKNEPGGKQRFRARLVGRGFKDNHTYDISEVYAPVEDITDVRVLLSMANRLDYDIRQLDIKTAFLNGYLEKTVHISIPDGFPNKAKLKNTYIRLQAAKSLVWVTCFPKKVI